ncbi:MAG TPA: sigma-70 family RNA polymerase sigma factor [Ktedonobacterales bacterium]
MTFVKDRAAAEEVVQDAWMGLLQGLDRFEGRSTLKTWLYHILVNKAKTRAQRDVRTIVFSSLAPDEGEDDEPAVDPTSFLAADHPQWPGHWASAPRAWDALPEERVISGETQERVRQAIAELPEAQRRVISLRDIEGWTTDEICGLLGISEANQRVLLHRARSKVRRALEAYFSEEEITAKEITAPASKPRSPDSRGATARPPA